MKFYSEYDHTETIYNMLDVNSSTKICHTDVDRIRTERQRQPKPFQEMQTIRHATPIRFNTQ